jgi:CyaY protein
VVAPAANDRLRQIDPQLAAHGAGQAFQGFQGNRGVVRIEQAVEACGADIDFENAGEILELEFANRSKIIINTQPPLHEIWMAAQSGGFHYKYTNGSWLNTRDNTELLGALSACASEQAGISLRF